MSLLSRSESELGDFVLEQVIIMREILHCSLEGQLARSREWKSLLRRKKMSVMPLCAEQGILSSTDKNAEAVPSCVLCELRWFVDKSERMCSPWEMPF